MIKKMMIRGMDAVMLSCEEATFLITKSEMTKVGCLKRMQLRMHLTACEFCRRFKTQSNYINQSLSQLEVSEFQESENKKKLPVEKKKELQSLIENQNH